MLIKIHAVHLILTFQVTTTMYNVNPIKKIDTSLSVTIVGKCHSMIGRWYMVGDACCEWEG